MSDHTLDTIRVLRPRQAASIIGLSLSTLNKMRLRGDGPQFVRLGRKSVGYPVTELRAWLDAGRRASTSDGAA